MKRLALLVATSEYPDGKDLKPLHGSLKDVDAMQRVLVAHGNFAQEDVTVLKNATRQAIEDAIHNLFNAPDRKKDDLVLFYFSGHGVIDEGGKLFLGTPSTRKEANNKLVKPSTVAATYLHEAMNDSKSQHQVLIFNCCFSGAFPLGMTVMDDGSVNLKNQLGGKGRAILTSSSSTQYSFQPDGEMSIYTRYLVEGIETGAADKDGDSKISVDELHEYAALKVSQESPNMTPAFFPVEQGGKIYIANVAQAKDDPRLVYRKELESRMVNGKWSLPARLLLESLRTRLELSEGDAEQIKTDVLKPILAKERKLQEYEKLVQAMLEECNPPTTQELKDLRDYQKDHLRLRDEDVAAIDSKHGLTFVPQPPADTKPQVQTKNDEKKNLILDLPNGVKLELVDVPAGRFMMGSNDYDSEKPIHEVTLNAFRMGKYAITQKQYQAVMGENPSHFEDNENCPVERVSWDDAMAFCQKLSEMTGQKVKLPSEAQWEYACRAGSTTKYCFGDDASKLGNYAWYDKNSGSKTHPVGEKLPNAWGLHDMHGNVWEWCEDVWHENYNGAPTDGTAWLRGGEQSIHALRGGSWNDLDVVCRSASRNWLVAVERYDTFGFRVVV